MFALNSALRAIQEVVPALSQLSAFFSTDSKNNKVHIDLMSNHFVEYSIFI